ncbi:hypothetical protein N7532_003291 [Penicillium argentinense]|uniref:penicillopepsin n=1 Tax=Penicillium argentinense TaxID=1131581 RepID=A0A9W9FM83_9EURO|nr:uncharacterized protein N7532_003291 [Penicillium argentinense]KAJ5102762.1 hypothetical protein N7532_003291 [Penicillium argentinense]
MHLPKPFIIGATMLATAEAGNSSFTANLTATGYGTVFDVPITIGDQTFDLLVDTGSSDTYVMKTGYTCINSLDNMIIPEEGCRYSNKTYTISETHRSISDEIFGIKYGDGIASGEMAYENVSLGGISVGDQKVGIVNVSNPMGDGVNSGLLGLAYPSITSAHPANHTSNQTYWYERLPYDPVLFTMHKEGFIEPYFSLALAHTPQNEPTSFGGYLTLGGLPPVAHSEGFSSVPVEILEDLPVAFTSGEKVRSYWATTVSGASYGSSAGNMAANETSFQAFVDSGNYMQYLPAAIVEPVNAMFSPPAIYNNKTQAYVVECDALAPEFGLKIGNQTFFHNGEDLIYRISNETCVSSLASSESISIEGLTLNIIGVPFLKNVIAVFDFGNNEMRFSKKLDLNSTASDNSGH